MNRLLRLGAVVAISTLALVGAATAHRSTNPPLAKLGTPLVFHFADGTNTLTFYLDGWRPDRRSGKTALDAHLRVLGTCTSGDCSLGSQSIQLVLRNGTRINAIADSDPDVGLWDGSAFRWNVSGMYSIGGRVIFVMPAKPKNTGNFKAWLKKANASRVAGLVITVGSETHGWATSPYY